MYGTTESIFLPYIYHCSLYARISLPDRFLTHFKTTVRQKANTQIGPALV
jgi:hypothetical protein